MREIKFRGKRRDSGEWAYGYYAKQIITFYNGAEFSHKKIDVIITEDRPNNSAFVQVDPETVGQCMGITDENNNEIWEDDIAKSIDSNYGYGAESDKHRDGYLYTKIPSIPELISDSEDLPGLFDHCPWHKRVTIVGNIHDNPELLEAK